MNLIVEINKILTNSKIKFKLSDNNLNENFKNFGIDSISLMNIIVNIEDHFKIMLPDEKLITIKTPSDLIKIVDDTLNQKK